MQQKAEEIVYAVIRVGSELSEEFEVKMRIHQGYAQSPFLFAVAVDVIVGVEPPQTPVDDHQKH